MWVTGDFGKNGKMASAVCTFDNSTGSMVKSGSVYLSDDKITGITNWASVANKAGTKSNKDDSQVEVKPEEVANTTKDGVDVLLCPASFTNQAVIPGLEGLVPEGNMKKLKVGDTVSFYAGYCNWKAKNTKFNECTPGDTAYTHTVVLDSAMMTAAGLATAALATLNF